MTDILEDLDRTVELPVELGAANGAGVTLNKDGTVRKKPGPKGPRNGTSRVSRAIPAPGKRAAKTAKPAGVDYRPAIVGIGQLVQMAIGLGSRFITSEKQRTAVQLDGLTIGLHVPNIAEALNETAKTEQRLAGLLDKLAVAGPYGLVVATVIPMVAQVLVNHGVASANEQAGTYTPDELMALAQQQMAAA